MNFGEALAALKEGKRVARAGWNGKGIWLLLCRPLPGAALGIAVTDAPSSAGAWESGLWLNGQVFGPDWDGPPRLLPWIGMKTADNCFVPWLASQTDLLCEDWEVVS